MCCGKRSGISDLITVPGLINLDFADVKSSCREWEWLDGCRVGDGENRAIEATQQAISSPLLEEAQFKVRRVSLLILPADPI
jgi:cell division protein FtsZ